MSRVDSGRHGRRRRRLRLVPLSSSGDGGSTGGQDPVRFDSRRHRAAVLVEADRQVVRRREATSSPTEGLLSKRAMRRFQRHPPRGLAMLELAGRPTQKRAHRRLRVFRSRRRKRGAWLSLGSFKDGVRLLFDQNWSRFGELPLEALKFKKNGGEDDEGRGI